MLKIAKERVFFQASPHVKDRRASQFSPGRYGSNTIITLEKLQITAPKNPAACSL